MNFLDAFNAVVKAAVPRKEGAPDAMSYDDEPSSLGVDSLDMVMVVAVFTDAYGISSDEQFDDVGKFTVGTLRDYVDAHKTRTPETIAQLLEFA